MIRRMMAPTVAMKIPARSNDSTFPSPTKLPRKPPTIAPAMPMRIVTIIPPGSFPGMMNFAIAPAMRPRKIQEKTPMLSFLVQIRRAGKDLFCVFHSGWRCISQNGITGGAGGRGGTNPNDINRAGSGGAGGAGVKGSEIGFSGGNTQRFKLDERFDDIQSGSTGFVSNLPPAPRPVTNSGTGRELVFRTAGLETRRRLDLVVDNRPFYVNPMPIISRRGG